MRRQHLKWRPVHTALKHDFRSDSKQPVPLAAAQLVTSNPAQHDTAPPPVPASSLSTSATVFMNQDTVRLWAICVPGNKSGEFSHPASLEKVILQTFLAESLPKSAQKSWTSKKKKTQRESLPHRGQAGPQPVTPGWGNTGCHGLWVSS